VSSFGWRSAMGKWTVFRGLPKLFEIVLPKLGPETVNVMGNAPCLGVRIMRRPNGSWRKKLYWLKSWSPDLLFGLWSEQTHADNSRNISAARTHARTHITVRSCTKRYAIIRPSLCWTQVKKHVAMHIKGSNWREMSQPIDTALPLLPRRGAGRSGVR